MRSRIRLAGLAAAVIGALACVVLPASPAAAVGGTPCSKPVNGQFDVNLWYGGNILGEYTGSWFHYVTDAGYETLDFYIGVKDRRADGYPPYFYLKIRYTDGSSWKTPWFHNYQGSAGGWECHGRSYTPPKSTKIATVVELWASVDNAPQIPEYKLYSRSAYS